MSQCESLRALAVVAGQRQYLSLGAGGRDLQVSASTTQYFVAAFVAKRAQHLSPNDFVEQTGLAKSIISSHSLASVKDRRSRPGDPGRVACLAREHTSHGGFQSSRWASGAAAGLAL